MEQTYADALESARYCRQELQKAYAAVMFSTSAVANYDEDFKQQERIWGPNNDIHPRAKNGLGLHNIFEHTLLQVMEMQKHLIDREASLGADDVASWTSIPVKRIEHVKVENSNGDSGNFTTPQGATDGSEVNVRQQEVGHNLNDLNFDASGQDRNSKSPLLETAKKEIDKIFQDIKEKSKAKNEIQVEKAPYHAKEEAKPAVMESENEKNEKLKKKKKKKKKKMKKSQISKLIEADLRQSNSSKKLSRENKAYRDSIEKVEHWNTTNGGIPQ